MNVALGLDVADVCCRSGKAPFAFVPSIAIKSPKHCIYPPPPVGIVKVQAVKALLSRFDLCFERLFLMIFETTPRNMIVCEHFELTRTCKIYFSGPKLQPSQGGPGKRLFAGSRSQTRVRETCSYQRSESLELRVDVFFFGSGFGCEINVG